MNANLQNRLRFIDYIVDRFGVINRGDLADYYGVCLRQATKDFIRYQKEAPGNVAYNPTLRCYVKTKEFRRVWR